MTDREIFLNAPVGATPEELAAYLDRRCGEDAGLRSRVEALLAADAEAGTGFMREAPGCGGAEEASEETVFEDFVLEGGKGKVIGNYKLLQQIGEGGFGAVYMAEQLRPVRRQVAFKIIKPGMDTRQIIARFEAERQALALMDHPNIAKVHDAGATGGGRPFFVMELVKGVPITTFCDERNLSTRERLDLFIDVCHAVQHAHQKGIIHRDLKPSNVMVTLHDDKAVVKVIDFGVAKATQGALTDKTLFTMIEQFIGTPAYMSPEQAQLSGLDIDTRSDIYSLGVLLYELLTGRTPFDAKALLGAGYDEMRRVIREDEPSKPSTRMSTLAEAELTDLAKHRRADPKRLRALIRGDLDWIVMKALEKDRTRRYDTANGLAMDVRRHLEDEPVEAGPPGVAYRIGKTMRRHRKPVLAGLAMVLLLAAGAAVSTWQAVRATREEDKARVSEEAALESERVAKEAARDADAYSDKLKVTSVQSDFAAANARLGAGDPGEALAHLARALEVDSGYWPAASQIVQILSDHAFLHQPPAMIADEAQDPIRWHSVSPDEKVVVTENSKMKGELWEAATGKRIAILADGRPVHNARFSKDGSLVFVALPDADGDVQGFDTRTGQPVTPPFPIAKNADHWFHVAPGDDPRPVLLVEHGDDGSMQVIRWSEGGWSEGPRLRTKGRLSSPGGPWASPFSLEARGDRFVLEPNGTAFAGHVHDSVTNHTPNRPQFGFSPDGKMVFGQFSDGATGVWNTATGEAVLPPMHHGFSPTAIRISPDSKWIAIVPRDQRMVLWRDLSEWDAPLRRCDVGYRVQKLGFSKAGDKCVATGWGEKEGKKASFGAVVIDLATGAVVSRIDQPGEIASYSLPVPPSHVNDMSWTNDSLIVDPWMAGAAFDDGGNLKVWELETGTLVSEIRFGDSPVALFTLLRDGRRLLTMHRDFTVRIWDVFTGTSITEPMRHGWYPYVALLGADQSRLMTYDPSIREITIRDTLTGKPLIEPFEHRQDGNWREHAWLEGSGQFVYATRVNGNGGGPVAELGLLTPASAAAPLRDTFLPTEAPVNHAEFDREGRRLLGCVSTGAGLPGSVRIWDARNFEVLDTLEHPAGVVYAEFSPTANTLVSVCLDGGVRLWDLAAREIVHEHFQEPILPNVSRNRDARDGSDGTPLFAYMTHKQGQARAHFSPDGATVAMHSVTGNIATWDVATGEEHMKVPVNLVYGLSNLAFSPDGRYLTFCANRRVPVIETFTGKEVSLRNLDLLGEDACFSHDGRSLFTLQWPGVARQWNLDRPGESRILPTGRVTTSEGLTHFTRHPTRNLIAAQTNWGPGSTAGFVCIWDYDTGELTTDPMLIEGQSESQLLDFSPNGLLIGGATKNGVLAVWEIESGQRLLHRPSRGEWAFSAKFDPDSTRLAVAGERGISIVHLPPVGRAAPDWLPELAEAVAGKRLDDKGRFGVVSSEELVALRERIDREPNRGRFTEWARWYLGDPAVRTISPWSKRTPTEDALVRSGVENLEGQLRALQLDPGNGRIAARIAYLLGTDPRRAELVPAVRQVWDGSAERYSDLARNWEPGEAEVWALRAATLEATGKHEAAGEALRRALALGAENPVALAAQAIHLDREGRTEDAYQSFVSATRFIAADSPGSRGAAEPYLLEPVRSLRALGPGAVSPSAMARLGLAKLRENAGDEDARMRDSDWLTRRALELAPDSAEALQARVVRRGYLIRALSAQAALEAEQLAAAGDRERAFVRTAVATVAGVIGASLGTSESEASVSSLGDAIDPWSTGLLAKLTPTQLLVPRDAIWSFWSEALAPPENWTSVDLNDTMWNSGPAKIGYGDADIVTPVPEITPEGRRRISCYFRHHFHSPETADPSPPAPILKLRLIRDDGAVVYLNGEEIVRSNMPAGSVTPDTFASKAAFEQGESEVHEFEVDGNLLRKGDNVLAAEVHQVGASSSDIGFMLQLTREKGIGDFLADLPADVMETAVEETTALLPEQEGTRDRWVFAFARGIASGTHESAAWLARARIQAELGEWNSALAAAEAYLSALSASTEKVNAIDLEQVCDLRSEILRRGGEPVANAGLGGVTILDALLGKCYSAHGSEAPVTVLVLNKLVEASTAAGIETDRVEIAGRVFGVNDAVTLSWQCGDALKRRDWPEARRGYAALIRHRSDEATTIHYALLGVLTAWSGDKDAHEEFCGTFFDHVEDSENWADLERAVKTYFALPPREDSPLFARAIEAARRCGELSSLDSARTDPWVALARGIAAYRDGDFESAIALLPIAGNPDAMHPCRAAALPFEVMANFKAGRLEMAAELLAKATETIPAPEAIPDFHTDYLIANLALREAKALMESPGGAQGK